MLTDILTWWLEQLASLLPQRLSGRATLSDGIVVQMDGSDAVASLRRRGTRTALGPLSQPGVLRRLRARRAGSVIVTLPPAALLQQTATLPLAAERDLTAVLGHEMDRLTPFAAKDLYWTWRVESRDRAAGRLTVRLLLVPRMAAAAVLAALATAGLRPAMLEIAAGSTIERLPLQMTASRRGNRAAGWACAALAGALLAVPVIRQERAITEAEDRVAALRPQVDLVDGLRRRITASASGTGLFAVEATRVGSALRAIAAVTAALPDDTYLTNLTMRDRKLALSGRSASAARLIPALSAGPDLRDPAFDAPVTRVNDRTELFSIRATLAP